MPNYRRAWTQGGCYFFTVVTYQRRPWLCLPEARQALRQAIQTVRAKHPFAIHAWVLLPDHLHCVWSLPEGDDNFALRWRLIKLIVTKQCRHLDCLHQDISRAKRKERTLWQRRYWEHRIRDEADYAAHCDYIHFNPVKHGLCERPDEWPWSTFHRFVQEGKYAAEWGAAKAPELDEGIGRE